MVDTRSHVNKLHELNTILLIAVVASLCGAETWKQMEEFAIAKEKLLSLYQMDCLRMILSIEFFQLLTQHNLKYVSLIGLRHYLIHLKVK